MKCPYYNNGISWYSAPRFHWPCTICDGTSELPDDYDTQQTKSQNDKSIEAHKAEGLNQELLCGMNRHC